MTPHRAVPGRGTFMIDRQLAGVGRIKRASGTTDSRILKGMNGMISDLYEAGLFPQLEAIRDGKLKPLAAYAIFRRTGVKGLPDASAMQAIETQWREWQARAKVTATRRMYSAAWKHIAKVVPDGATFAQLPAAVLAIRDVLMDHAPAFNRVRSSVLAFLRDRLGKQHLTYLEAAGVPPMREEPVDRPAPPIGRAIEVRDSLPANAATLWWDMVITGMGPKEMDSAWEVQENRIAIPGTKRKSRVRVVPRLGTPRRRAMGWKQYKAALATVGMQAYDARRAYEHLLEEAQVSRTRCKLYMGHALRDVTDRYGRADLDAFLASDRLSLLAYIAEAERQVTDRRRQGLKRA